MSISTPRSTPNRVLTASTLVLCLLLGACAATPKAGKPAPATQARSINLLEYAQSIAAATPEVQKKDAEEYARNLALNKDVVESRARLALLYSLPASRVRDSGKAQGLLDEVARDTPLDADGKTFIAVLRDYVAENNKLGLKARDEQKRGDGLQAKLDTQQARADSLQRKLDEIKNIEKTMTNRGRGI